MVVPPISYSFTPPRDVNATYGSFVYTPPIADAYSSHSRREAELMKRQKELAERELEMQSKLRSAEDKADSSFSSVFFAFLGFF